MPRLLPLFVFVACCHASPPPVADAVAAPARSHVVFESASGPSAVTVELALTPEAREVGLMHRDHLGADDGMLFVFPNEEPLSFWMHNTLVPLDMIFVRSDGRVVGIVADAAPLTDTPRTVGVPSRYVIEVNGGWAASHGVKVGDLVRLDDALEAARAQGGAR